MIGYHCILSSKHGDNFYLNLNSDKIKYLFRLKDLNVHSVAWDNTCTEDNTKVFISYQPFKILKGNIVRYTWWLNSSVSYWIFIKIVRRSGTSL